MSGDRSRGTAEGGPVPGDPAAAGEPGGSHPAPVVEGGGAAPPLPPDAAPRPSPRCAWQIVEGEAVLLDLEGRRIMGLNATGSFVWGLLDGRRTLAQVAAAVADCFHVGTERATADVTCFVSSLRDRGLVESAP